MKVKVSLVVLVVIVALGSASAWSYVGRNDGPADWHKLQADNVLCAKGKSQSPIDIQKDMVKEVTTLPALKFKYSKIKAKLNYNGHFVQVTPGEVESDEKVDEGREVVYEPQRLYLGESAYDLERISLHTPSEHYIGGTQYPLEVQMKHVNLKGEDIALSILFEAGDRSETISRLVGSIPSNKGQNITVINFDAADLIPTETAFYAYEGSDTSPPCEQGYKWFVFKHISQVGEATVTQLREITDETNRPIQPLNKRSIVTKKGAVQAAPSTK